jgi:hypothetical protein
MFADDSNFFLSDKTIPNLFLKMNEQLESISMWLKSNKLSLNTKKTSFLLFHSAYNKRNVPTLLPELKIDKRTIQRKHVTKFLGILIDENLTWNHHINNINSKICKSIGILYKSRDMLNKHLMKQFYYSFIHSYLSYGNIAWCSTNKTKLQSLYRSQKHALRTITFKNRLTHSKPIFDKLNILNIFEINVYQTLCFMFKCKIKTAPRIFHNLYTLNSPNKYAMRSNDNLKEPNCKSRFAQYSISYRAPRLWNKLILTNLSLENLITFSIFKTKTKKIFSQIEDIQQFF